MTGYLSRSVTAHGISNRNRISFNHNTYKNDELISTYVSDSEYNEKGERTKSIFKNYKDGKLYSTGTTEYSHPSSYLYTYHSVDEYYSSNGSKDIYVTDSLTNYAKAVIKDGKIVPAEKNSFREMNEAEQQEAEIIADKFIALSKSAGY
ncbi:MAG: hypothetical protein Q4B22_09680, partial [Eubacteriales bacterium]|nr:hypothetical protein [Eubacteriales bacterium]